MGTTVLHPQDCLRSRSRYKYQTSGMICPPQSAPRPRKSCPTTYGSVSDALLPKMVCQSSEAGLLPLPSHGRLVSSPIGISQMGNEAKHLKGRKMTERRDSFAFSKVASDAPVFKIMQRPKQGVVDVQVLANFVMVNEVKVRDFLADKVASSLSSKSFEKEVFNKDADNFNNQTRAQTTSVDVKVAGPKFKNRVLDTEMIVSKLRKDVFHQDGSVCQGGLSCAKVDASKSVGVLMSKPDVCKPSSVGTMSKQKNGRKEKIEYSPDDLVHPKISNAPTFTKVTAKYCTMKGGDVNQKTVIVHGPESKGNCLPGGMVPLRRTSTDIVKTMKQQSEPINIPLNPRSCTLTHAFSESSALLSCQERWAGPAYSSSPAPSSLPLPKLCLPQSRFSSLKIPPIAKQLSINVYKESFLGSSTPASENGGAWDAAFATKSLRKMLNLDSY